MVEACVRRRDFFGIGALGLALASTGRLGAEPGHPSAALGDILPNLKPAHPRLLVTDAMLDDCRARAAADPHHAAVVARVLKEAELILGEPVVPYGLSSGERPSMLGGSREIIRRTLNTAFAWRWTGDRRFADRARDELLSAARFPEWNHTHFLDLAETAFGVAVGYDWIHAALTPDERSTIRMALVEKALLWADRALRGSDDEWLGFPGYSWNWNPVCNGGVLAAAIAVAEDEPLLARDVMSGVVRSLPRALAAFGPDGAGSEGPVYWTYGVTYHVLAIAMLEAATGDGMGLGDTAPFRKTDLYRLWVQGPTGKAFNYGDCAEHLAPTAALAWLGKRHGHPQVVAHARGEMLEQIDQPKLAGEFDRFFLFYAIWYPEAAKPVRSPLPVGAHFRGGADIACFRGDWRDRDAAYLGFKAGCNATNHAHQDLGSFVLEGQGVRWASDFGADSYQLPGYFDSKAPSGGRYRIFRVTAASHATIMPEGVNQDVFATAPIESFESRADGGFAIARLDAAYAGHARSVRRGIAFDRLGRCVTIRDEVRGAAAGSVWRWTMPTEADIDINGTRAHLSLSGKTMLVTTQATGVRFERDDAHPPTPAESKNERYSLLVLRQPVDASGNLDIVVRLYPLGDDEHIAPKTLTLDLWNPA